MPTKAEKEYHDQLAQLGCIVCRLFHDEYTPQVSIHHCDGRVKKGSQMKVLPLCGKHHQIADTHKPKRWISRHGDGRRAFEERYDTEENLMRICNEMIGVEA